LRCVIIDDNAEFRETARDLLWREGVEVVGLAQTGAKALACAAETRPEVALADVYVGDESGLDVARRLAEGAGGDQR
jgi:DNA-binding NarL/FixJ family response regulator